MFIAQSVHRLKHAPGLYFVDAGEAYFVKQIGEL